MVSHDTTSLAERLGVHISRLSGIDVIFEQERDCVASMAAGDNQKGIEIHREEKRALLTAIESVKSHYHDSYHAQRRHFQAIKDDIINQVMSKIHIHLHLQNICLENILNIQYPLLLFEQMPFYMGAVR